MKNDLSSVSVVIPTYNSAGTLRKCLKSIKEQDYPKDKIEMIVVDRFSADDTQKIARKSGAKLIKAKVERSAARNIGVNAATKESILFIDSDMFLSPKVIKECVENIQSKKSLVGLNIPEKIIGKGVWAKIRDFERSFYNNTPIDAVRFLRKDAFLKVGGFDEKLYAGEDWDLHQRIQNLGEIGIIKSCIYHDEGDMNLTKYLKKKYCYAKCFNEAYIKKRNHDTCVKKQFGAYYRLLGVFLENGKWRKFITQPHLAFGVFGLKCLVGEVFLVAKS